MVPLRTRSDLKAAGRAFGVEAADALARIVAEHHPGGISPDRLDLLCSMMVSRAVQTADSYRHQGIPELWCRKFVRAALVAAGERCKAIGLAFTPPAGHA